MRSFGNQRGQSLLEFALIAPFVLFFLLALVDFGIAIDRRIVLDHAVREGARYASVGGQALTSGTPANASDVKTYTSAQAQGVVGGSAVGVCYLDDNGGGFGLGDTVKVTANYTYNFVTGFSAIIPGISPSISMNASASARAEYAIAGPALCPPGP